MEAGIFILTLIMVIIALIALLFQISSWKTQRALRKGNKDLMQDKDKSDGKRLALLIAFNVSILCMFVVALVSQICNWFVQYDEYEYKKKRDVEKRSEQMDSVYLTFQNKKSLTPDVKPDFKANIKEKADIKNFDIEIKTSIGEKVEDDLSAMIWRYEPGKYVLSLTPEGLAILETIKLQLDEVLRKNQNKGRNIEIIVEAIGSADALPYRKDVYYDGLLGDVLRDIKYYRYDEPNIPLSKTFIKEQTLMTNEGLALLRAWDAVEFLRRERYHIEDKNIKIYARKFDKYGAEYRRLDLTITLKDVFLEDYNDLSFGSKMVGRFRRQQSTEDRNATGIK
jgi:hypothetical protein